MSAGIIAAAAGLFAVTNVDDIFVLSLFFARGAGPRGAGPRGAGPRRAGPRGAAMRIVAGQYLGFAALLSIAIAAAYGATFLSESAIACLGVLPLALGLRAAWEAWRARRDRRRGAGDEPERRDEPDRRETRQVAAITFANGSDDIGAYVPVFAKAGVAGISVYAVVFLILVGAWCAAGWYFATRPAVAGLIGRWGHVLHPMVLIALGLFILIQGRAFGL